MHSDDTSIAKALRERAEARVRDIKLPQLLYSEVDMQALTYEHQVYRAELEVQNEDLRRTQEELTQATGRYRMLYECAPIGYFTLDLNGIVTDLNRMGSVMLGEEPGLVRGRAFDRFIEPMNRAAFQDFLAASDSNQEMRSIEVYLKNTARTPSSIVQLECVRTLEPGCSKPTILLAVTDVSKLKLAQQHALELNRTLERRVLERTGEADRKTKQLRTLTNKLIRAEYMERRRIAQNLHDDLAQVLVAGIMKTAAVREHITANDLDQQLAEIGEILKHATQYTRGLIGDLNPIALRDREITLAVSRLALEMEKFKLSVSVDSNVNVELQDELAVVVYQAIRELLFNIVKHAGTDAAWIHLDQKDHRLTVSVRDEGCGMPLSAGPPSDEKRERYGLAGIEERIVGIGGSFKVQSRPGSGTLCTFEVPIEINVDFEDSSLADAVAHRTTLAGKKPPYRVLLVDDHAEFRESLKRRLSRNAGFVEVVGEAHDGPEALMQTREICPDIIFMDINMPGMNGIDCTRRISNEFPGILIIGLSIRDDESARKAMQLAGAAGLVCKEDSAETLFDILNIAAAAGARDGIAP